jgi:hypothetical protein
MFKCPWLNGSEDFEYNLKKLSMIQAFWKRIVLARKLERLMPEIVAIYYSPGCKGEMLAERAFFRKA